MINFLVYGNQVNNTKEQNSNLWGRW